MTVTGKSGQAWALEVLNPAMKHVTERPFADPEVATRQLVQLASGIKAVQDGKIYIEKINYHSSTRSRQAARSSVPASGALSRKAGWSCMRAAPMRGC
jgi:hypothetical protein